ncbi:MAG: S1 RNA-binding domain-containing protein [Anaerolineae bacterium]|nr:S1 RNA-binding domain-containing protein [Anaerolineae bacterium]
MAKEATDIPQPRSISDLQPKMCLQGTVKQTQLYGAVLDIGLECDGVVHISQLAPERVNRVTDVVKPGDNVTVWVTKVNPEKKYIGLTMVEPPRVNWHDLAEGQVHTGTVMRLESYGAFVDIGTKRPGLLHVREMASGYVRHPSELVQINEEVQVRILKLDRRKRRIDLTMMGIEPETEDEPEEESTQTSMEIALQRARTQRQRQPERRHNKRQPANLSEREDILARTLKQHSKR